MSNSVFKEQTLLFWFLVYHRENLDDLYILATTDYEAMAAVHLMIWHECNRLKQYSNDVFRATQSSDIFGDI